MIPIHHKAVFKMLQQNLILGILVTMLSWNKGIPRRAI